MSRFEIRAAARSDEQQLFELATYLDSVNLPADRAAIARLLDTSERSFRREVEPALREHVFVLCDRDTSRIVGTSMIIAQLGRRDAPYIYFDVREEERYSRTLDRHFRHAVLSIGYSYDGPTEIGGLVVHPDFRTASSKLGTLASYVRFVYLAAFRDQFRSRILAELLPPLEPDGTSRLWEAIGRHFTGLTYREADRLSKQNKEFIRGLFPDGDIYVSLLAHEAQAVIGQVGPQTRGVEKLLRRIGFRYWNRVDPFDGGPHFVAELEEISLVRQTRRVPARPGIGTVQAIVAVDTPGPNFRAVLTEATLADGFAFVPPPILEQLGIEDDQQVLLLTLP